MALAYELASQHIKNYGVELVATRNLQALELHSMAKMSREGAEM